MGKTTLCIIGLGYVGLPLAHAFSKKGYDVTGYDVNEKRITELKNGHDRTNELSDEELKTSSIEYTMNPENIGKADIVILALPTPVDERNKPDLALLLSASETVGKHLKRGAIVVYESTVYPGVTEELCGPVLERASGMKAGEDFTLGYSPERINPGDKQHTVETIMKIVAGQDEATTDTLVELYGSIVKAGIHRAPSIKVAEMAKAIENAQRDLNIAYINEVAKLCNLIGIPTKDVLEAAGTKWNFLPFKPGLVGGHCIGVDPYYLVEKASQLGMDTHVISAGRSINDGMGAFVAEQICKHLADSSASTVLVLGLTFKENVPDTRNSKSIDVINALKASGIAVHVHDPLADDQAIGRTGCDKGELGQSTYDAVVLLVPHHEYIDGNSRPVIASAKESGLIYDLKSVLHESEVQNAGRRYAAL